MHPDVTLHEDPEYADYMLLDFRHFIRRPKRWKTHLFPKKTIFADYSDDPRLRFRAARRVRHYFKRSVVRYDTDGRPSFVDYPRTIVPISYAITREYLERAVPPGWDDHRPIDVSCFFEPAKGTTLSRQTVAERISNPSRQHARAQDRWSTRVGLTGKIGVEGRNNFQEEYFDQMRRTRVVVTCNRVPDWEGDYRLFEALASGAMVMVNTMLTPVRNRFIDCRHLVCFRNLDDLEDKLYYYLENEDQRLAVAQRGFDHAMKHHKVSDRIEEMVAHVESCPGDY
jgi:hypothetical protein